MSTSQKLKPNPVARKSSATIPKAGPTVPKKANTDTSVAPTTKEAVTGQSKVNVKGKNLERIVAEKASHRLLYNTILFVFLASLFSLYACPPPNSATSEPSIYTKLNPFIATPHLVPAWESYVCKPTNAYRTHVLEPYVVPHIKNRIRKVRENAIVRNYIEPVAVRAQVEGQNLWKTRLERPFKRGSLIAHQLHGRYVAPTYPALQARLNRLVAYVRYQLEHVYATVSKIVSSHPTYAKLSHQVTPLYQTAKSRVIHGYHSIVPHVHRARKSAHPHVKRLGGQAYSRGRQGVEIIIPRFAKSLETGLEQVEKVWGRIAAQLKELFATRVHPLLHPHYSTVEPHVNRFKKEIYNPYLASPIKQARPLLYSLILTPSYADIKRAIRAGYLDTRAAVDQGVESVKDTIHAMEDKVESVVDDVKAKVVPPATSASTSASSVIADAYNGKTARGPPKPSEWKDYRGEAIENAQRVAEASASRGSASVSSVSRSASASVQSASRKVVQGAGAVSASAQSVADKVTHTASSIAEQATASVRSAASGVSGQAERAATQAREYVRVSAARQAVHDAAAVVDGKIHEASASVHLAASQVSASGSSVIDHATRSVGSVASDMSASGSSVIEQATRSAGSVAVHASASVQSGASQVSASGSIVMDHATQSVVSGASRASQSAGSVISGGSSVVDRATKSVGSAASQVSASGSSIVDQATQSVYSAGAQATQSVQSVSGVARESASSAAGRVSQSASSVIEPNVSTLDPLDPTATEFGSNPGKTTVTHNPDSDQIAPLHDGQEVVGKIVPSGEGTTAKDPTYLKQEAAAAVHAYLQAHVPKIAQDRLSTLEHEAITTTRAFEQLLSQIDLTPEAKDVTANRVKVKASLKKVRSKLDDLVASLEAELRDGLITAGARKEVDKLIETAVHSSGSKSPSKLRQSYTDIVKSVIDTLNPVNDAVAQEGRLLLKPYRSDAKSRADQAIDLLDGKATAAVIPTETVAQVAYAAAGTIGRAKDQIIADIKHATEAGKAGAASVTQAVKDEL
ncbi:hypothetical protein QFC21_002960 [Naganishia friedmannii]|uniref:Uncharacterized protein n=1 Tax=Naganishia friedmannii TaxID=89922 RepID=A0ACC2VU10_9TREE|nr:hypothetical protein QFC21_002960 [Naganishia friedmannii]